MIERGVNPGSMRDIGRFTQYPPSSQPRIDGSWGREGGGIKYNSIFILIDLTRGSASLTHKIAQPNCGVKSEF